ncbi:sigma-54-dependent transcriptional regulator [Neptuniibacter sp.]|jgi:DNA-binding NtrC family response regulator|uniref:sigma-54-dependent transcriptional regulator n=1 Tax=Neptuniibacter sp. TaxID=1962643 RepID=UPI003B5B21CD
MSRILIVEDETIIRSALRRLLENNHFDVDDAASVDEATSRFNLKDFNLIISDLRLPGAPGTDLIGLARSVPVLIMTSYASLRSAVDAMKLGAVDYIAKPFDHEEMISSVNNILINASPSAQPEGVTDTGQIQPNSKMFGSCAAMQDLQKKIHKVARTSATVLINGESGTGKELAARAIHEQSTRSQTPMISVNCAAIPESLIESELFGHEKGAFTGAAAARSGLIEAADGGTLFLDEIGELPLEAQARLLRFMQEGEIRRVGSVQSKKVDVRLIAATHRNLKELTKTNQFREDLYYRLYVMELIVPPLRDRGTDILEIADKLLTNACQRMEIAKLTFTAEARSTMLGYKWPGNVRELEHAIERAAILAENGEINTELLGLDLTGQPRSESIESQLGNYNLQDNTQTDKEEQADLSLDDYFHRFVLENQEDMSETELARKLGVSRKCLWERRQKLGIPRRAKK